MIKINRGSDAVITIAFQDTPGVPLAITSPVVLDMDSALVDRLTVVPVDLSAGEFAVELEGTTPLVPARYVFRVQATVSGGDTVSSGEIAVQVVESGPASVAWRVEVPVNSADPAIITPGAVQIVVDAIDQVDAALAEAAEVTLRADQDFATSPDDAPLTFADVDGRVALQIGADGFPNWPHQVDFALHPQDAPLVLATRDGVVIQESAGVPVAPIAPFLSGDTLRAVTPEGVVDLAGVTGVTVASVAPHSDRAARVAVTDWPLFGAGRVGLVGPSSGGCIVPDDPNTLFVVIGLGQSNSVGVKGTDLATPLAMFGEDCLTFDVAGIGADVRGGLSGTASAPQVLDPDTITGFAPLRANDLIGTRGQTPLESCAFELARTARNVGARFRVCAVTFGQSNTGYDDLKKGTVPYDNMITGLTKVQALAAARGWRVVVLAALVMHGETDSGILNYQDLVAEWQGDVESDVQAITGQAAPVPFILHAPSSFKAESATLNHTSTRATRSMLQAHNENPGLINLVGPQYPFMDHYDPDYLHFTGIGNALLGDSFAEGVKDVCLRATRRTRPLQVLAASGTGTTVTVTLDVAHPPLAIDTTQVLAMAQAGITVQTSGAVEVPVTNVSVTGPAELTLTLASAVGSGGRLNIGTAPHLDPRAESTVPRTNIRDSRPTVAATGGAPLHTWLTHHLFNIGA